MHDAVTLERQVEDLTKLVGLLFRKVALLQQELTEIERDRIIGDEAVYIELSRAAQRELH